MHSLKTLNQSKSKALYFISSGKGTSHLSFNSLVVNMDLIFKASCGKMCVVLELDSGEISSYGRKYMSCSM